MASLSKKLDTNTVGEFYVDNTCINCDTCRVLAPSTYAQVYLKSAVVLQPSTPLEIRNATRALIACPTGSIGTINVNEKQNVREDFPLKLDDGVFYCGFNSPKSYGAHSYFIKHEDGNWLIDSPRYTPQLVKKFEKLGGIRYIFYTHRDDVSDGHKYAKKFPDVERIIHYYDKGAQPSAETKIKGYSDLEFHPDFSIIPTPGHTKGHMVLLYKNKFLFTGDHLFWNRIHQKLRSYHDLCWYDWNLQKQSIVKLLDYDFEWILPGHKHMINFPQAKMRKKMLELVRDLNLIDEDSEIYETFSTYIQ